MTNLYLIRITAFALSALLSSNLKAVEVTGIPDLTVHGSAAYSYFSATHNTIDFNSRELMVGANYKVNNTTSFYASVYTTEKETTLNSAFIRREHNLYNGMLEFELGRVQNNYGFYNEKRTSPSSRGVIVLPQAIYWDVMGQLANFSDGINIKYAIPSGFIFNYSYTKPTIKNQNQFMTTFDTPGEVEGRFAGSYGITYKNNNFSIGVQDINWRFYNNTFDTNQWVVLRNFGMKYSTEDWLASVEYSTDMVSKMKDNKIPPTQGVSYTLAYQVTDNIRVRGNYNKAVINDYEMRSYVPSIGVTVDKNIGVDYRNLSSPWFFRSEYHHVNGGVWLPYTNNVMTINKKWDLFTVQVGYEL